MKTLEMAVLLFDETKKCPPVENYETQKSIQKYPLQNIQLAPKFCLVLCLSINKAQCCVYVRLI